VKSWFARPADAGPVPPDDEQPEMARRLTPADRACCCPARPVVTVVIPAGRGRPHPVDLLLCGHHYRASLAALRAAGAGVYDNTGALIMAGEEQPAASREPAAARTDHPYRAPVAGRQD
jgi:hypothetical protein